MPKKEIARLLVGFRQFRNQAYKEGSPYLQLTNGWQGPKTLIIGCSDSRVDPAQLASASPGDLFIVRNVANLVPPFEPDGGRHGVSAAIEFAVVNLKVENIIVLGHRQCGGIRALLFPEETKAGGFVRQWVAIADRAKERALAAVGGGDQGALWRQCELESIRISIENLKSFPFVNEAISQNKLLLAGIYFDLENGDLLELNDADGTYSSFQI